MAQTNKFFYASDDNNAAMYDISVEQITPGYELVYQTMIDVLNHHFKRKFGENYKNTNGWILDVGAGTGAESIRIMKEFPCLKTIAIDSSESMKIVYENNYKNQFPNNHQHYKYIIEDIFNKDDNCIQFKNKFKVSLSGYTIHHFSIEKKREIYQKMYDFLEPGGLMMNIDLFAYKSEQIREDAHKFDVKYIEEKLSANDQLKTEWVNHYESGDNSLDTINLHIDILREIGFVDVECVFRYWQQGVIRATKPIKKDEYNIQDALDYRVALMEIKRELSTNKRIQETTFIQEKLLPYLKRKKEISCISISILSNADGEANLLYSEKVHDIFYDNKKFHGIFTSYDDVKFGQENVDFIDFLYFIGRDRKCPEFVTTISKNNQNQFESDDDWKLRQKYEILHIPAGEILFFTFLWRLIIGLIGTKEDLKIPLKDLSVDLLNKSKKHLWNNNNKEKTYIEQYLIEKIDEIRPKSESNETIKNIVSVYDNFLVHLDNSTSISAIKECGLDQEEKLKRMCDFIEKFILKTDENINLTDNMQILTIINKCSQLVSLNDDSTLGELLDNLHKFARFPILPYYFLMFLDKDKELKVQLVFPIWDTYSKNTMYRHTEPHESKIAYCLLTTKPLDEITEYKKNKWYNQKSEYYLIRDYVNELYSIFSMFSNPVIDKEYYEKEFNNHIEKIETATVQALISQVLQRTGAHDLGHVDSNASSVESLQKNEKYLGQYQYIDTGSELLKSYPTKDHEKLSCGENLPLIAHYNKFQNVRRQFLADLATSEPNILINNEIYKDIFIPYNDNLIYNNRITSISNEAFKYKIIINNCTNETPVEIKQQGRFNNIANDISVAIPNGELGHQALYILYGNLIRNTVKHDNITNFTESNPLGIYFDIHDYAKDSNLYEIRLYTNAYNYDEMAIKKLVLKRNEHFNEDIASKEDKNKLRDFALGSIEMEACATYLRKISSKVINNENFDLFDKRDEYRYEYYDEKDCDLNTCYNKHNKFMDEKKEPVIISAYAQKESQNSLKYSLGYRFYLLKPQKVLIVYNDENNELISLLNNDCDKKKQFEQAGIYYMYLRDFISSVEGAKASTYNHEFLALLDCSNDCITESYMGSISKRIIELSSITKDKNAQEIYDSCWAAWMKTYSKTVQIIDKDNNIKEAESETIKYVKLLNHAEGYSDCNPNVYNEITASHLFLGTTNEARKKKGNAYYESVLTNVIIIDERIQNNIVLQGKSYDGEKQTKVFYAHYFDNIGIHIPSPDVYQDTKSYLDKHKNDPNLNAKNLQGEKEKIKNYISGIKENCKFIVIHLGLIEKLYDGQKDEPQNSEIIEYLVGKEHLYKVVITTARGIPNNISCECPFLPYSIIENAVLLFDKYRLIQALYSSRKSLKN